MGRGVRARSISGLWLKAAEPGLDISNDVIKKLDAAAKPPAQ